jgi:hypothetical protein
VDRAEPQPVVAAPPSGAVVVPAVELQAGVHPAVAPRAVAQAGRHQVAAAGVAAVVALRVPSVAPAVRNVVAASPRSCAVKSSTRWKPRRSVAYG